MMVPTKGTGGAVIDGGMDEKHQKFHSEVSEGVALKAKAISYYKNAEIRNLMVQHAEGREVAIRFFDRFKRPDQINHSGDVLELALQGATSFHASEERWQNPLLLAGNPDRKELEQIRIAWDLILDIDCPDWELAKAITLVFIESLSAHGISGITCKFSGNKGFHIGVAAESFPDSFGGKRIKSLFPEAPRAIAAYLIDFIEKKKYVMPDKEGILFKTKAHEQKFPYSKLPKHKEDLIVKRCENCGTPARKNQKQLFEYTCKKCGEYSVSETDALACAKCGFPVHAEKKDLRCRCTPPGQKSKFTPDIVDIAALLDLDTLLISSRHVYRMPYSLHEKSGLVSLPMLLKHVLEFDKRTATPSEVISLEKKQSFLDITSARKGEAETLLRNSMDFAERSPLAKMEENSRQRANFERREVTSTKFVDDEMKIPETCFPPCMRLLLGKMSDGKKRALFILTNFLLGCRWPPEEIETRLRTWNSSQEEPIRDTIITGHFRYHLAKSKLSDADNSPPPNCDKYYPDLQVCRPDELCRTIKNPLQYAKKKGRMANSTSNNSRRSSKDPKNAPNSQQREPAKKKKTRKQAETEESS